jgi:hypothetical protein
MELASAVASDRLPCGAQVADLIEQAADRGGWRSPHQAACEHCQALLPQLERLWRPVRDLAAERVAVPEGLVAAVMYQVRRLVRAAWLGVHAGTRGTTRVARTAVAKLAALAARTVPGVGGVLSHVPEPAEVAGGRTGLQLDLVTEYGQSIPAVAEAVRRSGTAVDINIHDVTPPPPRP